MSEPQSVDNLFNAWYHGLSVTGKKRSVLAGELDKEMLADWAFHAGYHAAVIMMTKEKL